MADISFSQEDEGRFVRGQRGIDPAKALEIIKEYKPNRSPSSEIPQGGSLLEIDFELTEIPLELTQEGERNKFFFAFGSPTKARDIFEDS